MDSINIVKSGSTLSFNNFDKVIYIKTFTCHTINSATIDKPMPERQYFSVKSESLL